MKTKNSVLPLQKKEICSLSGGLQRGEFLLLRTKTEWYYGILRNQMASQKSSTYPEGFEPIRILDLGLELKYDIRSARLKVPRFIVSPGAKRIDRVWRRVPAEVYRWEDTEEHWLRRRLAEKHAARVAHLADAGPGVGQ